MIRCSSMITMAFAPATACAIAALLAALCFTPPAAKAGGCSNATKRLTEDLILRGDYERATDHLLLAEFNCPQPSQRLAAAALQARLFELSQKRPTAIRLLERFRQREPLLPKALSGAIDKEQARLFLLDEQLQAAKAKLAALSDPQLSYADLAASFAEIQQQSSNAPWYALASALVPGSGQVLQGEPMNAVSALFMIAIPTYFAIEGKRNDEHAFAASMTTLASFFYLGNIASSYRTAKRKEHNHKRRAWQERVSGSFVPLFLGREGELGFSSGVRLKLNP